MQIGIFELLRDRQQQIEAGVEYVEMLREYWTARADLLHLLSGRLPAAEGPRPNGKTRQTRMKENGNGSSLPREKRLPSAPHMKIGGACNDGSVPP